MSLLTDLRDAGRALDIQFQPNSNEVAGILGAVVHYLEHGDEFLKAAEGGVDDVTKLLEPKTGPEEAPAQTPSPAGASTPAPAAEPYAPPAEPSAASAPVSDQELEAQIADLQAQLASRHATAQQSTVTHEPGVSDAGNV